MSKLGDPIIANYCSFDVWLRYNEFNDLYDKVKKNYPSEAALLKLPGKRYLGNNFDPDFIKGRRVGLHDFIINLMKVCLQ